MPNIKDRTIIVTGGARGIGATYATSLAAHGAKIAVCDIRMPDETCEAIEAQGGEALGGVADISDSASILAFVDQVRSRFGSIHGLVNNAAMFSSIQPRPFEQISWTEFDTVMKVNVRGTFEFIKAVTPAMRAAGYGKIVNVGSSTFFKGTPNLTHYVASKGAVVAMTRTLARECGPDGIRINCLAPGLTLSDSVLLAPEHFSAELIGSSVARRSIPKEQVPEDLVGAVEFLLGPESDFMTGQTVLVDGGENFH
jgi:NAD(P)-dependent dehydrogenase (short-subunit alcohol dehydrogenase family)